MLLGFLPDLILLLSSDLAGLAKTLKKNMPRTATAKCPEKKLANKTLVDKLKHLNFLPILGLFILGVKKFFAKYLIQYVFCFLFNYSPILYSYLSINFIKYISIKVNKIMILKSIDEKQILIEAKLLQGHSSQGDGFLTESEINTRILKALSYG